MEKRIAIIGYGTGGSTVAAYVRKYCRKCRVTVFEKNPYPLYHPCALPDVISGELNVDDIIEKEPLTPGLDFHLLSLVTRIDKEEKIVYYRENGVEKHVSYDELVLATGSVPWIPRSLQESLKHENIFTLKTPEDAVRIREKALRSKVAVVVGAGAIGIEVAFALRKLGLETYLVEALNQVLPGGLDRDMSIIAKRYIEDKGITVLVSSPVQGIEPQEEKLIVYTTNETINSDLVVLATGMAPNTKLAIEAGLNVDEKGFVIVDDYLRTSNPYIYAVGDIIRTKDYITGKPVTSMLANTAFYQGRIIALNITGYEKKYEGTLSPFVLSTEGLSVGSIGLTKEKANRLGLNVSSIKIQATNKPPYMPSSEKVHVKIVYETDTGRILGGQFVCKECDVSKYIDVLSALIRKQGKVDDLVYVETCYMPRVSEIYSPLFVAGESILRRIKRF